jgi:hypothetical protein
MIRAPMNRPFREPVSGDPADALERIAELEAELARQVARTNAAHAAAQDRLYWLDRWHIDLDALMRHRLAGNAVAALAVAKAAYDQGRGALRDIRRRAGKVRVAAEQKGRERSRLRTTDPPEAAAEFERDLRKAGLADTPATDLLYERLLPGDVEGLETRLAPADAARWSVADAVERRRLSLELLCRDGDAEAIQRAGLSEAEGPLAARSFADADLVLGSFDAVGLTLEADSRVLGFCSSDGVVRILGAAVPQASWAGAAAAGARPPLELEPASFDAAHALSAWTHLSRAR